ncbi:hypothetical protein ScPMuIL_002839 [Solemya velum]
MILSLYHYSSAWDPLASMIRDKPLLHIPRLTNRKRRAICSLNDHGYDRSVKDYLKRRYTTQNHGPYLVYQKNLLRIVKEELVEKEW